MKRSISDRERREAVEYVHSLFDNLPQDAQDRAKDWFQTHTDSYWKSGASLKEIVDRAYQEATMRPTSLVPSWPSYAPDHYYPFSMPAAPQNALVAYIHSNPSGKFSASHFSDVANQAVKLTVAERMQSSVPHLVQLARDVMMRDPTCEEIEVTDTFRGGVKRSGFFGSYVEDPVTFTRTIRVRKIR